MAQAKFIDNPLFDLILSRMATDYPDIAEKCLRVGADIIADEMKRRLIGVLLPQSRAGELVASFGITPVKRNRNGDYTTHLGFDGYQKPGYGSFPNGVPFQLIARSFESGAVVGGRYKTSENTGKRKKKARGDMMYWREATPFAAPAVKASRARAMKEMAEMAEKEMAKRVEKNKNGGK